MAGKNGVFPTPFTSGARYDNLNAVMNAGDLVRLDVGCEWNHYGGDLGRTVPVSGRYSTDQREIWNIFVSAYHAGAKSLREGATQDQVSPQLARFLVRNRCGRGWYLDRGDSTLCRPMGAPISSRYGQVPWDEIPPMLDKEMADIEHLYK